MRIKVSDEIPGSGGREKVSHVADVDGATYVASSGGLGRLFEPDEPIAFKDMRPVVELSQYLGSPHTASD
jgi:hypothetical protein